MLSRALHLNPLPWHSISLYGGQNWEAPFCTSCISSPSACVWAGSPFSMKTRKPLPSSLCVCLGWVLLAARSPEALLPGSCWVVVLVLSWLILCVCEFLWRWISQTLFSPHSGKRAIWPGVLLSRDTSGCCHNSRNRPLPSYIFSTTINSPPTPQRVTVKLACHSSWHTSPHGEWDISVCKPLEEDYYVDTSIILVIHGLLLLNGDSTKSRWSLVLMDEDKTAFSSKTK